MARLLETKLRPPPVPAGWVRRPRLYESLASFETGLVVVSAAAGFGKSTMVVEWARAQDRPMAWYSLDRYDSDVGLFGEYLATAVGSLVGRPSGLVSLPGGHDVDPRAIVATLVEDLSDAPPRSLLVLDDHHELHGREIHETLGYLAENLPDGVVLVVVSRADPPLPLSRLRLLDRLREVRGDDLRFDPGDVADYFRQTARLDLDADQTRAIAAQSEGWVSALQLAAMRVQADPASSLTDTMSARDPHIAGYLVDEVLDRVPGGLARFLQETSVFARFDTELCRVVTGHEDAGHQIEELARRNAFLVPLGGGWYRYHQLFADLLRSRLRRSDPDHSTALLERAADVCEQRGLVEDAIGYALQAGDVAHAGRIVESSMASAIGAGEMTRLRSWLRLFPRPAGPAEHAIALGWAWCRLFEGELTAARARIDRIEADHLDDFAVDPRGELELMRAVAAFQDGDAAGAEAHAGRALDLLPSSASDLEGLARLYVGRALHAQARRGRARAHLERAATLGTGGTTLAAVSALFWLGVVELDHGDMAAAERAMVRAREAGATATGPASDTHPASGIGDIGLAYVRLNQLDTEEAVRLAERGTRLLQRTTLVEMVFRAFFVRAESLSVAGHFAAAEAAADEGIAWLQGRRIGGGPLETWLLMARARNSWRRGNPAAAEELLGRVRARGLGSPNVDEALGFYEAADQASAALRRGDVEAGRRLLAAVPDDPGANVMFAVKRHALTAALHELQGDPRAAVECLEAAVELAHTGYRFQFSFVGPVLRPVLQRLVGRSGHDEFVRSVIDRLPAEGRAATEQPIEPLTDREREVLAEIAAGYTNDEIADRLFISRGTVKRHAANIYRKLGVHHRAEAVARGRERNLVD